MKSGWLAVNVLAIGVVYCAIAVSREDPLRPAAEKDEASRRRSVQTYWVEQLADGLKLSSIDGLASEWLYLDCRTDRWFCAAFAAASSPRIRSPELLQAFRIRSMDSNIFYSIPITSRILYLMIAEGSTEAHHTAIYRASYDEKALAQVQRIFRVTDEVSGAVPSSARMAFLPDKTLLVAVPAGNPYRTRAQRLDSHLGKILRINRDGTDPADNPFVETRNALAEIWSYGHRVPLGLFWDETNDVMWEVESGPRGGDEFNFLKAGTNFGWPAAGGSITPASRSRPCSRAPASRTFCMVAFDHTIGSDPLSIGLPTSPGMETFSSVP